MSPREGGTYVPEPRDEFRRARLGVARPDQIQQLGFQEFRLAQSMGVRPYGLDLSGKDTQEKKDQIMVTVAQYISDIELGPVLLDAQGREQEDKQAEKRNKIFDAIAGPCVSLLEKIEKQYPGLKSVQKFSIDKGAFSLFLLTPPRDNLQVQSINLSEVLKKDKMGNFSLDEKSINTALKSQTKTSLDTLRHSLETESLFDGAIVITYEQKDIVKKTGGVILGTLGVAGAIDTTEYLVKKMMYRDEAGKMREVDLKIVKSLLNGIGDKTRINGLMMKVMQKIGLVYNPIRSAYTNVTTLGLDRATEKMKTITRPELERRIGKQTSETDFQRDRGAFLTELARTPRTQLPAIAAKFTGGVIGGLVHYMFWGVFFQEYQKNSSDLANVYKGLAETGLFYAGASVGGRATPGLWKMPASLVGGGLAVLGGHVLSGKMKLDKKMWRTFPERMASDGTKSLETHILSGGATNDGVDLINTDIGIPGTRGGAVFYNPLGQDGIMPDVNFARTHIDFGVNPREYLQSRIGGTDTHWNKRMDEFVSWSTDMIMKILWEYDNNKGYFSPSNIREQSGVSIEAKKKSLLIERLRPVLDADGGKNMRNNLIIEDCVSYITEKLSKITDQSIRKQKLSILLSNYGNVLKLDEQSLAYDTEVIEKNKSVIDNQKMEYLMKLSPEKRAMAQKVFERLLDGKKLVSEKTMTIHATRGAPRQILQYDQTELSTYQELIDDSNPVSSEWHDRLGYVEKKVDLVQASFHLPDIAIPLADKRNIYLRTYFDLMMSDYIVALRDKNGVPLIELNRKYSMDISNIGTGKSFDSSQLRKELMEGLIKQNPSIPQILSKQANQNQPTQGDVFVYLLHLYTEYREQKRFLDTQKSLGYGTTWKSRLLN